VCIERESKRERKCVAVVRYMTFDLYVCVCVCVGARRHAHARTHMLNAHEYIMCTQSVQNPKDGVTGGFAMLRLVEFLRSLLSSQFEQ